VSSLTSGDITPDAPSPAGAAKFLRVTDPAGEETTQGLKGRLDRVEQSRVAVTPLQFYTGPENGLAGITLERRRLPGHPRTYPAHLRRTVRFNSPPQFPETRSVPYLLELLIKKAAVRGPAGTARQHIAFRGNNHLVPRIQASLSQVRSIEYLVPVAAVLLELVRRLEPEFDSEFIGNAFGFPGILAAQRLVVEGNGLALCGLVFAQGLEKDALGTMLMRESNKVGQLIDVTPHTEEGEFHLWHGLRQLPLPLLERFEAAYNVFKPARGTNLPVCLGPTGIDADHKPIQACFDDPPGKVVLDNRPVGDGSHEDPVTFELRQEFRVQVSREHCLTPQPTEFGMGKVWEKSAEAVEHLARHDNVLIGINVAMGLGAHHAAEIAAGTYLEEERVRERHEPAGKQ